MLQGIVKLPRFQTGVFMGTLVYSGEWVDGQWGGEGKIVYPDGTSYSGQVEAALYHGYGYKQEYAKIPCTYLVHWLQGSSIQGWICLQRRVASE